MEYKFLIEQNKEYRELYKKYNEILKEKRNALVEINNKALENLDLDKLEYYELKELIDLIDFNVDKELMKKLNETYLSKKPYTHKVVEKMDFLTKKQNIQLDVNLSYFKNRYILNVFWTKIGILDGDIKKKVVEKLLEENLIRVDYRLLCPKCINYIALLKEDDLNLIKELDNLKLEIKKYEDNESEEHSEELEELYDRYYDIKEGDNPLYRYCCECDHEAEFDDLDDMLKYCKEAYFIL